MVSDKTVKEWFFDLEAEGSVFEYKIQGHSLYFVLRFNIEMVYRYALSGSGKNGVFSEVKLFIRRCLNKILLKPAPVGANITTGNIEYKTAPLLFVSTSNWTTTPGESVELVDIIKYYRSQGQVINFVQPQNDDAIKQQPYHDGFFSINNASREYLSDTDTRLLKKMLTALSKHFKIDFLNQYQPFKERISHVLSLADQLIKIIRDTRARYVFARSVYTEPWVLIACKSTGANCIEVQHGVVTENNIYYQSVHARLCAEFMFPNYILTLGEEWRKILLSQHYICSSTAVLTVGCNDIPVVRSKNVNGPCTVLVCLQHGIFSIDDILIRFLKKYRSELPGLNIRLHVRPHPNALSQTIALYSEYTDEHFRMINSREVGFYDNLAEADLLVSASSMCLYEAIAIGVPAVSFHKFKEVTIPSELSYVASEDDLFSFIVSVKGKTHQQKMVPYMSPFNTEVLNRFLN